MEFVQENESMNKKGALRGLHYQKRFPQGKLVRVILGEVFDAAVDLRRQSAAFGQWISVILSGEKHNQLYLQPGFVHGFSVLSGKAVFAYKTTDYYHPEDEGGIYWGDETIGIQWPVRSVNGVFCLEDGVPITLSEKDKKQPTRQQVFVTEAGDKQP